MCCGLPNSLIPHLHVVIEVTQGANFVGRAFHVQIGRSGRQEREKPNPLPWSSQVMAMDFRGNVRVRPPHLDVTWSVRILVHAKNWCMDVHTIANSQIFWWEI